MTCSRHPWSTAFAGVLVTLLLAGAGGAQAPTPNPLAVSPMPICGPLDATFERLFEDLKLRRSWRGSHENRSGELELAVGPGGVWFLFYLAPDRQDRQHVCLIARGRDSKALFGNQV